MSHPIPGLRRGMEQGGLVHRTPASQRAAAEARQRRPLLVDYANATKLRVVSWGDCGGDGDERQIDDILELELDGSAPQRRRKVMRALGAALDRGGLSAVNFEFVWERPK